MTISIAMAGKGGTGKTTIAALFVRSLLKSGRRPVLAVDADPNTNLPEALGVQVERTVGGTLEQFMGERTGIPPGMTKDAYLEFRLNEVVVERTGFDLLVMGRPEGPGCYCAANNTLRKYIDVLGANYAAVVMDNEAGMEHVSRRTTRSVDHLVLVSDNAVRGVRAAGRIDALCAELEIDARRKWLVINRVTDGVAPEVVEAAAAAGLEIAAAIADDREIARAELAGRPLLDVPDGAVSVAAVDQLLSAMLANGPP